MKSKEFEEKIEYAKKVLNSLMDPEITLSKSLELYKEGMKALKEATKLLEDAKLEIQKIQKENE